MARGVFLLPQIAHRIAHHGRQAEIQQKQCDCDDAAQDARVEQQPLQGQLGASPHLGHPMAPGDHGKHQVGRGGVEQPAEPSTA